MCSSNVTLFLRRAAEKARLFSIGTSPSASVWARNVGGVFSVTFVSVDSSVSCAGVASGPSRFWPVVLGVIVGRQGVHRVDQDCEVWTVAEPVYRVSG